MRCCPRSCAAVEHGAARPRRRPAPSPPGLALAAAARVPAACARHWAKTTRVGTVFLKVQLPILPPPGVLFFFFFFCHFASPSILFILEAPVSRRWNYIRRPVVLVYSLVGLASWGKGGGGGFGSSGRGAGFHYLFEGSWRVFCGRRLYLSNESEGGISISSSLVSSQPRSRNSTLAVHSQAMLYTFPRSYHFLRQKKRTKKNKPPEMAHSTPVIPCLQSPSVESTVLHNDSSLRYSPGTEGCAKALFLQCQCKGARRNRLGGFRSRDWFMYEGRRKKEEKASSSRPCSRSSRGQGGEVVGLPPMPLG